MRAFLFLLLLCFSVFNYTLAQSPGGISANNTMWIRSDIGLTSAANIVSQWQELSGSNITGNFTVQSLTGTVNVQTGPAVIDAGINFNPYLRFDGVTNSLSSINIFPGTALVSNSTVTIFQVLNIKGGIVWLKWETDQVGATGRLGFENAAGTIRFDFPKAVPASAGQNIGVTNVLNKHSLSTCYADAASSVNRLNGAVDNTIPIPAPGDFAAGNDKIVIGNENLLNLPAQVDMAEVIIYSVTLTAAERNKIESYLAVKYGFTLDQAAANANDYTASNGTIIWNRTANSGYASDITGIGRDDASALSQKQSKSINTTALVTIYNGTYAAGNFPLLNSANTNTFSTDFSYLLTGDNAGSITLDQCIFNGKGQRMQRVWKVSKNGPAFPVTLAVDQAAVAASVKNLIVSSNPAFPPGNTTIYPLTAANGKLYTDITLNQDDYFSFATDTLVVNMVPTQPTCSSPNDGGVTTTVTGNNQPLTYSWSPSGQTTANLVNVAGGTYILTITQGSCQSTQQITLNSPAAPAAPVANAVSVCPGNTATLTVQSPVVGYIYYWYATATSIGPLGTGTSFTTPPILVATTYYVEAETGPCTSVRTPVAVSLITVTAPVVNGVTICSRNTATLNVQNPIAGYTYNWYAAASGGTSIGTGISFTTPVLNTATTYYVESVNLTCSSARTAAVVSIDNVSAPAAAPVAVCQGNAAILSVQNPNAAYSYDWYAAASGGVSLGSGFSFTTPPVLAATMYYVEASDGSCNSIRTSVVVTLTAPLDSPRVTATNITINSITFSWLPVAGAAGYEVSVDGGLYITPSSGSAGTTHAVSGLSPSQTVSIKVIALGLPQGCGNSLPGHATATSYGDGFYVPTAFTPNGDIKNDLLTPVLPGGSALEYFTIYNRWGQKVFSTTTIGAGWDGKLKGQLQPLSTFVWICRYIFRGNIINEKGTFTLFY